MAATKIRQGARLQIVIEGDTSEKKKKGKKEDEFTLRSTFEKNLDDANFLISVPMKDGKRVEPDQFKKLIIRYGEGTNQFVVEGYVEEVVKQGIRQYWKIRKVTNERSFSQRADDRYSFEEMIGYTKYAWLTDSTIDKPVENGKCIDMSAGGIAFFESDPMTVGEIIETTFPTLGRTKAGKGFVIRGEVCWQRGADKGTGYKFKTGIKFVYENTDDKKLVQEYIGVIAKNAAKV